MIPNAGQGNWVDPKRDAKSRSWPKPLAIEDSPWAKWYEAGKEDDSIIYDRARRACREANEDLQLGSFDITHGSMSRKLVESTPIRIVKPRCFTADMVKDLVSRELEKVEEMRSSKSEWKKKCSDFGYVIAGVATKLKPTIDLLMPQSLEYTLPYGCLMLIFTGSIARRDKKDAVFEIMRTLAEDVPAFEFYKDIFPTTEIKVTLVSFYIQTLDLLWRLAKYSSLGFLAQLGDALFPRQKYTFANYTTPIKSSAMKLKNLCDAGHVAEQRSIKKLVESTDSQVKELHVEIQTLLNVHAYELQTLSLHIERIENNRKLSDDAEARRQVSKLLDIWNEEVGDVEHELQRWQKIHFQTDQRDHWTSNGILPCISKWRELPSNSVLWVCSESQGRQAWLTEFSLDLIRVCSSQGQMVTFALCDRPEDVKWTPSLLVKHLISQLLHLNPKLSLEEPEIFNTRMFRRAKSFKSTVKLLTSVLAKLNSRLDPILLIIDRLDLCLRDPETSVEQNIATSLSSLARMFPKTLKIIITTGQIVSSRELPGLAISFAAIVTRRRPRRKYEDAERAIDRRLLMRYKKDARSLSAAEMSRLRKRGLIPPTRRKKYAESFVDD